jgi:hypothetical protein
VLVVLPEEFESACAQSPARAAAGPGPTVPISGSGSPTAAGSGLEPIRTGAWCSRSATPSPAGEGTD